MSYPRRRSLHPHLLAILVGLIAGPAWSAPPDDEEDMADAFELAPRPAAKVRMKAAAPAAAYDFAGSAAAESLGATPGGAQDIAYARDAIERGEVPHARAFTPEGLFSEHDLPIRLDPQRPCTTTLCVRAEAAPVRLAVQPEVQVLAQVGFDTNLSAADFRREPLNLIAVVDTSGSMSGQPHALVQASLKKLISQLRPDDQLGIVLYDSQAHVALRPTKIRDRASLRRGISQIRSGGSTAMEEGLRLGFDLAQRSSSRFKGTTRVMLFTDERPNVGRTDAGSFMAMARAASRRGIGLTTIGVSTHFGAELASAISSVRGGNLFFFPNPEDMRGHFEEKLDTMVSELAYDMELVVQPAAGYRIEGVYGIPGEGVEWTSRGGIRLAIETLFLSRDKGGIYLGLASEDGRAQASSVSVLDLDLSYEERGGRKVHEQLSASLVPRGQRSPGLVRGELLVDEVTSLRAAAEAHHRDNDQERAYRLVQAVVTRLHQEGGAWSAGELETVTELESLLAQMSGHRGESERPRRTPKRRELLSGLPADFGN